MNDCFWAGMSSTQRSEGMNAYFDGYIHSKMTLKQFVEQYENALANEVESENEEDGKSWRSFIPLITKSGLEKQFQSVYTNEKSQPSYMGQSMWPNMIPHNMRPNMAQGGSIFQFSPSSCPTETGFNQFMYAFPSSQANMPTLSSSHDWRGQSNITNSLENVHSLIGRTAPPDFLAKLTYLIWNHHEKIEHIDTVRAYTFGSHYFVEVDTVLPEDMLRF
ncbi:hypothetical protein RHGRI_017053 [Rhododendron griersonianum]|uniref:Protein FAR1-RELATED SEQUENCE n=1 Tax=Rhododendron griersonianum TaxID=479676 RepID=A0AAV6JWI0_9ERIC|nr:hypothetical protein RHGRI_017053 [Rhododendron griersonianum]